MSLLLDIEHPHQTALDVVKDVENYGGEVVHDWLLMAAGAAFVG